MLKFLTDPYGISAMASQLTGFLFLENIKMEKQRTNLPYRQIIPHFLTPKTFINGFFPYGALQAYSKGMIFGLNQTYIRPFISSFNLHSQMTNMIVGLSTGITEALLTSPLLYARLHLNKNLIERNSQKIPFKLGSIFKGANVLVLKRTIDWSSRFVLIDCVKDVNKKLISDETSFFHSKLFTTFTGSALSSVLSAPIDRLLPIVYTNQSVIDVWKKQGISFFYKGFPFRCLSTAHYTTFLLVLPDFIKLLIKQ